MEISLFLAKVLGLYMVILGAVMLVRVKAFKQLVAEFVSSPAIFFIGALMGLIIGILLVVSHNIWVMNWTVVITLLAWLTLIRGIVHLAYPVVVFKLGKSL